jgi:glucokinase
LREKHGFVSNELVCAGIGLDPIHRALCEIFDRPYKIVPPGNMLELAAIGDEMFLELCHIRARATMGAVGDLVLANGAFGGAVLAGGVSERLATYLKAQDCLDRFLANGARASFLTDVPIHLMHDPMAPLIGAAALSLKDQKSRKHQH